MREKSYLSERNYNQTDYNKMNLNHEKIKFWKKIAGEEFLNEIIKYVPAIKGYFMDSRFQNRVVPSPVTQYSPRSIEFFDMKKYITKRNDRNFIRFYEHFLLIALSQLKDSTSEIRKYKILIWEDYLDIVLCRLEKICTRTLIQEIADYKSENKLFGTTPEEEYEYFSNTFLGEKSYRVTLFDKYPILERSIYEILERTHAFIYEALKRLERDQEKIQSEICEGSVYHCVQRMKGEISDSHNGGKGTLIFSLDNGYKVVYKPHSIENEKFFYQIIRCLGSDCGENFLPLKMVVGNEYGFEEYIIHRECMTEKEVRHYYMKLGMELCLLHLLGTNDIHCENLIANGEYPMIIDLENLISNGEKSSENGIDSYINEYIRSSVLCSGILPYSKYGGNVLSKPKDEGDVNFKVPIVVNGFTSNIRIAYRKAKKTKTVSCAVYRGKETEAQHYLKELKTGFSKLYIWCMNHKEEMMCLLNPLLHMKSRFLLADTQRYAMMLNSSYHPSLLTDGANREIYLHTMWYGRSFENRAAHNYVKEEIFELLNHDIPYFYVIHNMTSLFSENGKEIENFFHISPIDVIKQRIEKMNTKELKIQENLIDMAMELCEEEQDRVVNFERKRVGKDKSTEINKQQILKAVEKIGDMGIKNMFYDEKSKEIGWYSLRVASRGIYWWKLEPSGMYLYDGISGNLLFYTLLSAISSNEKYRMISQKLESQVFDYTDKEVIRNESYKERHSTGILNGESSIVYVYLLIYSVKKERCYLEYACKHAEIVLQYLKTENNMDLTDGMAGAVVVLCQLYKMTNKTRYLEEAVTYGEKILNNAIKSEEGFCWKIPGEETPLLGAAHGNAGFLYPFKKLYEITKDEKYLEVIAEIIKYENFYYDEETEDWMDFRGNQETRIVAVKDTPSAWCHGAGGILLSRLEVLDIVKNQEVRNVIQEDIRRAVNKLLKSGYRKGMCLCHGSCGNYMILKAYYKKYKEEGVIEKINNFVETLIENILEDKLQLMPREKYSIGFMNGYLGIGYFLAKTFFTMICLMFFNNM